MNQFIITESCSTLRTLGREALRGRWKLGFIAFLVYNLIMLVPSFISALPIPGMSSFMVTGLYPFLVSGPLMLGISIFTLRLFRNEEPEIGQVFYGFERFAKAFGLMLLVGLFIFLWSLLFIIPGIIAALRYSQVFFILADNPDIGVFECIRRSKAMMWGNKAKYFFMNLSFIGWMILAQIPVQIISRIIYPNESMYFDPMAMPSFEEIWAMYTPSMSEFVLVTVASLGLVVLSVYMNVTYAGFYEMLAGNLKPGYISSTAEVVGAGSEEPHRQTDIPGGAEYDRQTEISGGSEYERQTRDDNRRTENEREG